MGTEQKAFGTQLKFGSTVVGNLLSVAAPDFKMEFVDTTHHGTTPAWRTKRPVLVDPGKTQFEIQMTSAQFAALIALVDPTATASAWTIVLPFTTPINVTFNGWLANFPIKKAEINGLLVVEAEIEVTGQVAMA